jgi:hypothetical protein
MGMDVFYYYTYLFYSKVFPKDDPYLTTINTNGLSFALFFVGLFNLATGYFYCKNLENWQILIIIILIMLINYIIYESNNRLSLIINRTPKFFKNHTISIIITFFIHIMFFVVFYFCVIYSIGICNGCK